MRMSAISLPLSSILAAARRNWIVYGGGVVRYAYTSSPGRWRLAAPTSPSASTPIPEAEKSNAATLRRNFLLHEDA